MASVIVWCLARDWVQVKKNIYWSEFKCSFLFIAQSKYLSTLLGCSSSEAELHEKVFKLVDDDETRFSAIKRYGHYGNVNLIAI